MRLAGMVIDEAQKIKNHGALAGRLELSGEKGLGVLDRSRRR